MTGSDATTIAERLADVRARIDAVERPWHHEVEVTAVTKAFDASVVRAAVDAGCTVIAENYAQELQSKRGAIEALEHRPRVEFIGHLQSNKVRRIADLVDRWCTIDRDSIANEIAKRAPGAEVVIQVNSTGERQKGGCEPEAVAALRNTCDELGLRAVGLMTIGPTGAPPEAAAPGFRMVRSMVDELGLRVCSMGMTADLEVAVACGSTNVRVGSALFGRRPDAAPRARAERPVHHERHRSG